VKTVLGADRLRSSALLLVGAVVATVAFLAAPRAAGDAAGHTWGPFVLVAGLLAIGVVANEDGVFTSAASVLDRLPGGDTTLYVAAMLLAACVTAVLNLDTSVAFLTPVLVQVARRRGAPEERFLYGCVFMSNAASLLLPGSNLTNLLVVAGLHASGSAFLARMLAPWVAAVTVTIVVVALAFRRRLAGAPPPAGRPVPPRRLGMLGMLIAVVLILAIPHPALPVAAVGLVLAAVRLARRRLDPRRLAAGVDVRSLLGVFLVALSLGTLARVWSYPARLMLGAGRVATAGIAAVASVLVNNLPAAVLLGSRMPAHPQSLLFGLDIGPNLAVTGSLSALIWWQAARSAGARPSARRYSAGGRCWCRSPSPPPWPPDLSRDLPGPLSGPFAHLRLPHPVALAGRRRTPSAPAGARRPPRRRRHPADRGSPRERPESAVVPVRSRDDGHV
jgi:arsenical pump membrane protein